MQGSSKPSSYCRDDPILELATPRDLQIVCGEHYIGVAPEDTSTGFSPEDEVVLDIEEIIIHPDYSAEDGPIAGSDISAYLINETQIVGKLRQKKFIQHVFQS